MKMTELMSLDAKNPFKVFKGVFFKVQWRIAESNR
jgi:hypothetical protein